MIDNYEQVQNVFVERFSEVEDMIAKSIISHYQQNAGCIDLVQSREGALLCVKKYKKI